MIRPRAHLRELRPDQIFPAVGANQITLALQVLQESVRGALIQPRNVTDRLQPQSRGRRLDRLQNLKNLRNHADCHRFRPSSSLSSHVIHLLYSIGNRFQVLKRPLSSCPTSAPHFPDSQGSQPVASPPFVSLFETAFKQIKVFY